MRIVVSLFLGEYFAGRIEDVDNQDEFKRIPEQKEILVSIICADDKKIEMYANLRWRNFLRYAITEINKQQSVYFRKNGDKSINF